MKKRIFSMLLCIALLAGLCAIPAGAAFQVTYYNEEVYAGGILDLYAFVGEDDLSGYTFRWQFEGLQDSWIDLDDNANYKGTKTNHLQMYTKADADYTQWDEIPFRCMVTKDGLTQYTPELHMTIRPYSAMLEGMKNWGISLFEPQLTNVSGLSTKDNVTYTASAYAGSNIEILCGGSTESQKPILVNSEVQLKREIKISENNKYIVTGDKTAYVPYTIGTNAVKIEINMRIIMAGVDKGVYQTKTINLTTKKPETIAKGVTTKECSMLRAPYNESQTLGSLPQGAVVEVVGKSGGYYQVYARNVISYIPEGLLRVDTPVSDAVIKEVELTIPAPVAGESPSFTCQFQSPSCKLYETDPITWTDAETKVALKPGDKFQEGRKYNLSIWVAAKQGYRFQLDASGKPKLTGAINGNLPPFFYVAYEQDPEKVIELVYNFAQTPKAPEHECQLTKVAKVTPSCTTQGHEAYYKCSCGKCYADANAITEINPATWGVLAATGHKPGSWTGNGTHHYKKCQVCYAIIAGTNAPHSGGTATCQQKAVCTVCNLSYGQTNENHTPDTKWTACAGLYHAHLCTLCGAHCDPEDHKPGPEATDTQPQKCTVCDYILQPAKNHVHNLTQVQTKEPTCMNPGEKSHYACDGCNALFADKDGKQVIADINTLTLPPLGHMTEEVWQVDANYHWRNCSRCKAILEETWMLHEEADGKCTTCGYDINAGMTILPGDETLPSEQTEPTETDPTAEATQPQPDPDGSTRQLPWTLMWILLGCMACISAGIIVFVILWSKRRR